MLQNLKKLRIQHGVTQKQLADVLGISQQSINKYENHNIEPDIATLKRLAIYFGVSIDYLVGHSDLPQHDRAIFAEALSAEEAQLLETYRTLTPAQKQSILFILRNYREAGLD